MTCLGNIFMADNLKEMVTMLRIKVILKQVCPNTGTGTTPLQEFQMTQTQSCLSFFAEIHT